MGPWRGEELRTLEGHQGRDTASSHERECSWGGSMFYEDAIGMAAKGNAPATSQWEEFTCISKSLTDITVVKCGT